VSLSDSIVIFIQIDIIIIIIINYSLMTASNLSEIIGYGSIKIISLTLSLTRKCNKLAPVGFDLVCLSAGRLNQIFPFKNLSILFVISPGAL